MSKRAREWAIRILLAVGVPVALFAAVEGSLRIAGYGYEPGFFIPIPGAAAVTTNDTFGWRFFPRAIARMPVPARIDVPKPAGVYRIVVLGESAAMGIPDPSFSFGRMLEVMLQRQHPTLRFEVINAAMTAINSHAIVRIANDAVKLEPDLFIVLAGNNEAVGPYGPATVFTGALPRLPVLRLSVRMQETRIGQLLARGLQRKPAFTEWRGMEMFKERQIPERDARLQTMYEYFRRNLEDTIAIARGSGARVVLATVPVNVTDCPPFGSEHATGFDAQEAWERSYGAALETEQHGDVKRAANLYRDAVKLDPEYAEAWFRLGRLTRERQHFERARDLDTLRFRADSKINGIIREAAQGRAMLVDAEREFATAASDAKLYYEHVHLRPEGNYLLASAIGRAVGTMLPDKAVAAEPAANVVFSTLHLTAWDRQRMAKQMAALTARPPFTQQMEHARSREHWKTDIQVREGAARAARDEYASAVRQRKDDLLLRARYSELLRETGDNTEAAAQMTELIRAVPGKKAWYCDLGAALAAGGKLQDATAAYEQALKIDPEFAVAHFGMGTVASRARRTDEAIQHYRTAVRINPEYAEAHNNLGLALAAQGDTTDAENELRAALELQPDSAGVHYNLASVLVRRNLPREAEAEFRSAIRIDPNMSEAHYGLAGLLARSGDAAGAIDLYREAIRTNPRLAEAHYDLGLLLIARGRVDDAIDHYRIAIALRPGYAEAHNNLGSALARKGDLTAAVAEFERALELRPDFAPARENLRRAAAVHAARN